MSRRPLEEAAPRGAVRAWGRLAALALTCSLLPRHAFAGGGGPEPSTAEAPPEEAASGDGQAAGDGQPAGDDGPPPPAVVEPAAGRAPMSITISGGGAKGAYMAGQLYYTEHALRLSDTGAEPRVYTGASAGAINTLISVLADCGPMARSPRASVQWGVWIPVGLRELYEPDRQGETALLSRHGFEPALAELARRWSAGLPESCDVLVGIAVSRLRPRIVELMPGFPSLPRTVEKVLLRITGRGAGKPPQLRNYVDPVQAVPQMILPLDGDDARPFEALQALVFASSAFPVGFMPVDVAHCLSEPGKPPRCTPGEAVSAQFVDGGVFDNQPLGLSLQAMRGVTRGPDGALAIADTPRASFLPESKFYYVDPRVSTFPLPAASDAPPVTGVFGVLAEMFGMVDSAFSSELLGVFEREPKIRDRLVLTSRRFPHISSTFGGLLERSFREFDFYLGMYDAARAARRGALGPLTRFPEDVFTADGDAAAVEGWRPFGCLRAVFDGEGDPADRCSGEALEDFRILAQVTLDRQLDLCRAAAADHPDCGSDAATRRVPGVTALPDGERLRAEAESDLDYLLRLLGAYHFYFHDLGLDRDNAEDARWVLLRLAQDMVSHLAAGQPENGLPLGVLGRVGVDLALGYVPPVHILHMSLGLGAELGYSVGIDDPDASWMRFTAALELDGFSSLLDSDDNYLGLRPKAGLEFEVLAGAHAQLRLGARAGYQFSTADSFTREACDFDDEDTLPCSRFLTEAYVASTFVGIVRLHVAGVFMPRMHAEQSHRFGVRPMVGIQLNSPF
ncbi:MAG: patatin-like phospholipase family protein [Polyangiaceae bacterium]|nr:patatin-like phospholipase family protein [Polyangiaceae bacterium]